MSAKEAQTEAEHAEDKSDAAHKAVDEIKDTLKCIKYEVKQLKSRPVNEPVTIAERSVPLDDSILDELQNKYF